MTKTKQRPCWVKVGAFILEPTFASTRLVAKCEDEADAPLASSAPSLFRVTTDLLTEVNNYRLGVINRNEPPVCEFGPPAPGADSKLIQRLNLLCDEANIIIARASR